MDTLNTVQLREHLGTGVLCRQSSNPTVRHRHFEVKSTKLIKTSVLLEQNSASEWGSAEEAEPHPWETDEVETGVKSHSEQGGAVWSSDALRCCSLTSHLQSSLTLSASKRKKRQ